MNLTSAWARPLPRLLCIAGLLLLLVVVFFSQLYFAGYVTSWSRAFLQEVVYWLSCGILAILILWMCRHLHRAAYGWVPYALAPLCLKGCAEGSTSMPHGFVARAIRSAGINLAIYVSFVLVWRGPRRFPARLSIGAQTTQRRRQGRGAFGHGGVRQ